MNQYEYLMIKALRDESKRHKKQRCVQALTKIESVKEELGFDMQVLFPWQIRLTKVNSFDRIVLDIFPQKNKYHLCSSILSEYSTYKHLDKFINKIFKYRPVEDA